MTLATACGLSCSRINFFPDRDGILADGDEKVLEDLLKSFFKVSLITALSCSRESYCRTIHIPGRAHSGTPIGISRTSLQQPESNRQGDGQSLRSNADDDNHTCSDRAFHSPMRVRRGSCRS